MTVHSDNVMRQIIDNNGIKFIMKGEDYHCENGPAIILVDGRKEWWLDGVHYSFEEWCSELKLSKEKCIELKLLHG